MISRLSIPAQVTMSPNSVLLPPCPPCSAHTGQGGTNYAKTSRIHFADFLMVVPVDLLFHIPFKMFTKLLREVIMTIFFNY